MIWINLSFVYDKTVLILKMTCVKHFNLQVQQIKLFSTTASKDPTQCSVCRTPVEPLGLHLNLCQFYRTLAVTKAGLEGGARVPKLSSQLLSLLKAVLCWQQQNNYSDLHDRCDKIWII
jgi:hypothetical protein